MADTEAASPLSFARFLDKMKEPASSDLVRSIKLFIKRFEDRAPGYVSDPEADSASVQDFLLRSEQTFRTHPAWQGCGTEVLEQAIEGLEKYVMSKIWRQTFGCCREDRDRDERYSRLATALGFVQLDTLAGTQGVVPDASLLAMAQGELLKMDRYKAPRDKLLCLVNVKTLVEEVVGVAARAGAGFGGADAFFPVFLLTVIGSKPPRLASNIEYVRRFRSRPRLSGQFDFMLCNLESAAMYLDTVDYKHLHISQDEFLARLSEAGIPEAQMELRGLTATTEQPHAAPFNSDSLLQQHPEQLVHGGLEAINKPAEPQQQETSPQLPAAAYVHQSSAPIPTPPRHLDLDLVQQQPQSGVSPSNGSLGLGGLTPLPALASTPQLLHRPVTCGESCPVVAGLVADGSALVLQEEARGTLQLRHPYVYASAADLSVGDVRAVLAAYRQLVYKYEALVLALNHQQRDHSHHQQLKEEERSPSSPLLPLELLTINTAPPSSTNLPSKEGEDEDEPPTPSLAAGAGAGALADGGQGQGADILVLEGGEGLSNSMPLIDLGV